MLVTTYTNWEHILGAGSALLSALLWAVAAILFAHIGRTLNAKALNLGKGIVALICLSSILLTTQLPDFHPPEFWYLALSGLLGITIGDTLYFLTLQRLGAKITLLVGTLIPVVTAISASLLFSEPIGFLSAMGLAMTIFGVTYVLWNKVENKTTRRFWFSGLVIASLYILTESGGILLTKFGLVHYESLEATFIRQAWGIAGLVFWGLSASNLISDFKPLKHDSKLIRLFILTSFIGAFLGTWLSIIALELTYTAVAVSLNSTSPLFVLPISYWFLREKISQKAILGSIIATVGVGLYFFSVV